MMDSLELTDDTGRVLARYDSAADDVTFDWVLIEDTAQSESAVARVLLAARYQVGYVAPLPEVE